LQFIVYIDFDQFKKIYQFQHLPLAHQALLQQHSQSTFSALFLANTLSFSSLAIL